MALTMSIENGGIYKRSVLAALAFICMASFFSATATAQEMFDFHITATDADTAIKDLSRQTGVSTIFQSADVEGIQINSLEGRYTLQQALDVLFDGTLLSGNLTETEVITISKISSSETALNDKGEDTMGNRSKNITVLTAAVALLTGISANQPAFAQEGSNLNLEEILVTGRKRTESLTDVPVSISVLSQEFIAEGAVHDQYDLFDAAVGFEMDSAYGERNTAQPGIRGVQGNGFGVTQQKMNSFMDGFPLVGQQGSIQFDDVSAVEMYRGPQGAAFGRATFAGAINYVSRNPTESFEGSVEIGTSNQGRDEFQLSLAGPISDTLGYTFDYSTDEYVGPDEWISSDGYHLSNTRTEYGSLKLVWEPNDFFKAQVRQIYHRVNDRPGNRYYADYDETLACTNMNLAGRGAAPYYNGVVTDACDLSIPDWGIQRNHDLTEQMGLSPGDVNYDLLLSESVLDPRSINDKDRTMATLDFAVDDALIQVLLMRADEFSMGDQDSDNTAGVPVITGGPNLYDGGGTSISNAVGHMANPYYMDETYYEVRWISPEDNRFRYVIGVSDYTALVPGQGDNNVTGTRLGLNGVAIRGFVDGDGNTVLGQPFGPSSIYGDRIFNTGVYANLAYDISDATTVTLEARYQKDTVDNQNAIENDADGNPKRLTSTTKSVQPRLSITHDLNDTLTVYGQASRGTNPGGVNIGYTFDEVQTSLALANAAGDVAFDVDTFSTFVEETLTNYEIGVKGSAFDNKLNFTAAVYSLIWEDQTGVFGVGWDDNPAATQPGGWNYDPVTGGELYDNVGQRTTINQGTVKNKGIEFEGSYFLTDAWTVNGNFTIMDAKYDEFCDVISTGGNFGLASDCVNEQTGVAGVSFEGNVPEGISETSYAIGVAYRAPFGESGWNLSGRLDLRNQGEQYVDNLNIMKIGTRNVVNGSLSLSDGSWNGRLYVNNLLDDDIPRDVQVGNDANIAANRPKNFLVFPTKPREIGLSVSYDF